MSHEEEDTGPSLKELLTKNLEANGTLGNIQAQLRASIFLTLEEEFKEKNIPLVNEKTKQLLASPIGKTAVAIIQDFLQCLDLEFSLGVFNPEVNVSSSDQTYDRKTLLNLFDSKIVLKEYFNITITGSKTYNCIFFIQDEKSPVLFKLIEGLQCSNKVNKDENGSNNEPNSAKNESSFQPNTEKDGLLHPSSIPSQESALPKCSNQTVGVKILDPVKEDSSKKEPLITSIKTSTKDNDSTNSTDDLYEDDDFSSGSDAISATESKKESSALEANEDAESGSNSKKEPEKQEDAEVDEVSEEILTESIESLLNTNSEMSNVTEDITVSESKPVADYQEVLSL